MNINFTLQNAQGVPISIQHETPGHYYRLLHFNKIGKASYKGKKVQLQRRLATFQTLG